ncbi:MAG: DmpA family aminopeptidase [Anaerolineae bacterium]
MSEAMHKRPRAREIGIVVGELPTGTWNAITDVEGVLVGHCTLISGHGPLVPGRGPVRTGVTAILPHGGNLFRDKVAASAHVINGFGKCTGLPQVLELGTLETPILLTNTLNVGIVADACVQWCLERNPDIGITTSTVNPVVGECSDGFLSDIQGRHVHAEHVFAALNAAISGPVEEGSVGAGTGMSAFGFKAGVGTASRRLPASLGAFTVGVLLVANFGRPHDLLVMGVPVGRTLASGGSSPEAGDGSVMVVIATDAPLVPHQLARLARRAGHGLARTGAVASHGSGDFVLAFSTTHRIAHQPSALTRMVELVEDNAPVLDGLFRAAIEATEEGVYNALLRADRMEGRDGHVREALPVDAVLELLRQYHRIP